MVNSEPPIINKWLKWNERSEWNGRERVNGVNEVNESSGLSGTEWSETERKRGV